MVTDDLPCSTITNQIAFDQRDSNARCTAVAKRWFPNWKLETLAPSLPESYRNFMIAI